MFGYPRIIVCAPRYGWKWNEEPTVIGFSEKNRAPAWCDRILWKGSGIEQKYYTSQPKLRVSDHKPVLSLFEVAVRSIQTISEQIEEKIKKFTKHFELSRYSHTFEIRFSHTCTCTFYTCSQISLISHAQMEFCVIGHV